MKRLLAFALAVLLGLSIFPMGIFAAVSAGEYSFEGLGEYRKNFQYLTNDGKIGIPVVVDTYYKGNASATTKETSVILYVMGYVGAREVGREDTVTILSDLLDEGYIVVVLDYLGNEKATTPNLDWSIQNIRMGISKYCPKMKYKPEEVYVVPDGYRIARNIVYYDFAEHSRKGTLNRIIDVYNTDEGFRTSKGSRIPNADERVKSIDRCLKPDGTPIDLQLKLDIIYPSEAEVEAPMVMISSSSETRMEICSTNPKRPLDVGALMRGCAVAIYDHVYTPMSRDDHYGYYSGAFSQESYTGVSSHTSASRCIHYYADKFGYSREKYAVMGHSKGSMCGLLANDDPESLDWGTSGVGLYNEYYGEQPFLVYDDGTPIESSVTVAYRSMGAGASQRNKYLNADNAPTMLCCGTADQFGSWNYWYQENIDYELSGVDYLSMPMPDQGHTYPIGIDPTYKYDRFMAFMDFLMYYLKEDQPARVLYSSAADGKLMGDAYITRYDKEGTKDFSHSVVTPDNQIFVQFVAPVTEESAKSGITLWDMTESRQVEVTYRKKGNGNRWYLDPENSIMVGHKYEIRVASSVESVLNGKSIGEGAVYEFTA